MMRLTALSPAHALPPVTFPGLTLSELPYRAALRIAAYDRAGTEAALARFGLRFPAPGRAVETASGTLLWYGVDEALLLAPPEAQASDAALKTALEGVAAVSEFGDALCHLRLSGALAEAVLARLVPIDLRASAFGPDATARTLLGKQNLSIRRAGPDGFDLITARSMAQSAVHVISRAMEMVSAR